MKRSVILPFSALIIVLTLILFPSASNDGEILTESKLGLPDVSAQSACIIECNTEDVIYEKASTLPLPMASTTKIMTAIVVIENTPLDNVITVHQDATGIEGSSIYLCKGEKLTTKELLYALLLESANDAACALAVEVGGSVEGFVDMMNDKATELGLTNTNFTDPHGLSSDDHYTTAQDLARLMSYCMKNEKFAEITATKKFALKGSNDSYSRLLINHNKLLSSFEGTKGGKTGFTKKAGRCLVSFCERNGVKLCAVTLNAPDDWNDHKKMYSYGFTLYKRITLEGAGQFEYSAPVCGGNFKKITAHTRSDISATVRVNGCDIKRIIYMRHFYYPEISQGQMIGYIVYTCGDITLAKTPLYADFDVDNKKDERGIFEKIKDLII